MDEDEMPMSNLPVTWWIAGIATVAGLAMLIRWLWKVDRG